MAFDLPEKAPVQHNRGAQLSKIGKRFGLNGILTYPGAIQIVATMS